MHELSLAQSICETARTNINDTQVLKCVVVECGPLCGVVPETLEYCFSIAAPHFGFENAKMDLRIKQAHARCPSCLEQFVVESMWDPCPSCNHLPVTVEGGRELRVVELEVEEKH
jgi:hydrogenase nickel incorporation protein HypA/HybF